MLGFHSWPVSAGCVSVMWSVTWVRILLHAKSGRFGRCAHKTRIRHTSAVRHVLLEDIRLDYYYSNVTAIGHHTTSETWKWLYFTPLERISWMCLLGTNTSVMHALSRLMIFGLVVARGIVPASGFLWFGRMSIWTTPCLVVPISLWTAVDGREPAGSGGRRNLQVSMRRFRHDLDHRS